MKVHMLAALAAVTLAGAIAAQDKDKDKEKKIEITAAQQQQIDAWKATAAKWAADPAVVAAVVAQNQKGPIAKMDEKAWKALRRRSPEVEAFQTNDAAKALAAKAKESNKVVSEAFVSAQKGEKVAFLEKTSSYVHLGKAKFDVPFQKLEAWQGQPEFDESTQAYAVQIAVPVKAKPDDKQAIGVLVVGLNLSALAQPAPNK